MMCDETAVNQDAEFIECSVSTDVDDSYAAEHTGNVNVDDPAIPEIKQEALRPVFKQEFGRQCDERDTGKLCDFMEVRLRS